MNNLIYLLIFISISVNSFSKNIEFIGLSKLSLDDIQAITSVDINKSNFNDSTVNQLIKELYVSDLIYDVYSNEYPNYFQINIEENNLIENIFINGNLRISDEDILNLLKSKPNSFLNIKSISEDIKLISALYTDIGFNEVTINTFTEKFNENKRNLIFEIFEGSQSKISKISFIGNKYFSSKFLKNEIKTENVNFYNFFTYGSNLNQELFTNDLQTIKNLYNRNGFFNADISYSLELDSFNNYHVKFLIKENIQSKIIDVSYDNKSNNEKIPEFNKITEKFLKKLKKNNYFYNQDIISNHINELNYFEVSSNSNFIYEFLISYKDLDVDIIFSQKSDKNKLVKDINIFGNVITKDKTLRSKLELEPGDKFNQTLIERNLQEINRLPYIINSNYDLIDNDNESTNIEINIKENKKTGNLLFAGTATGDVGIGFQLGIKDNNFLGSGNTVDSKFSINTEQTMFDLSFIHFPYSNPNLKNIYSIINNEYDFISSFGYKTRLQSLQYDTVFDYNDKISISTGFSLSSTEGHSPSNQSDIAITDNIDTFNDVNFNLGITRDSRNDFLYPSDGNLNSLYLSFSPENLSDNSYYKITIESDNYIKLNNSNNYFFSSNSLGVADSFDGRLKTKDAFSLGGLNFKGFDFRGVGPLSSNNIYLGGNKYFTSTLGYGTNFLFDKKDNIYFKLFSTVGSVWDSDYNSNNDLKLRSSAGISFDLLTPIGPISFIYATPIQKELNDKDRFFNFTIGSSF